MLTIVLITTTLVLIAISPVVAIAICKVVKETKKEGEKLKEKPEKFTWNEILIKPVIRFISNFIKALKINYLGYWYCYGCEKYHSPRVKSFDLNPGVLVSLYKRKVCSLHKDKIRAN